MPPHSRDWSFDANQCIKILFRGSEFLIYASFVLLGQSYLKAIGGYSYYAPIPEWMPPPDWTPPYWNGTSPGWKVPPYPPPGWRPVVGGVNPFTLEPVAKKIMQSLSPEDLPQAVSGQYGPGVYVSWLLVMLSSMVSTIITPPHTPDQHRIRVDADILTTNIYAIVAAADLIYRTYRYSFSDRGASYLSAGQVLWNAWIFSISTIGPNRSKPLNPRLRVQYTALWIFIVSQALTRQYLFADTYGWRGSEYAPKYALRILRDAAATTVPLAIYYRWSAAIPYRFVKLLAGITFVFWHTHGQILINNLWIFHPLPVDDIATWRFRVLFPQGRSEITELDQAVSLATTVLILLWQWKVWKLGFIAVRYAKSSRRRTHSIGEETLVDLEEIHSVV